MKRYISILLLILLIPVLTACGPEEVSDMPYAATIGDTTVSGLFTGVMEDDLPIGQGVFAYTDDSVAVSYTGTWENGLLVGEVDMVYDGYEVEYDGVVYIGKYEGPAVNGLPNGTGTFSAESLEAYFTYTGTWSNGKISGAGTVDTNHYTVTFSDGTVRIGQYVGEVSDGKASGKGLFTTQNDAGITYTHEGQWQNGLPHGYGCRKWDSPNAYVQEGNFVEGDYVPTPLEYFTARGTLPEGKYEIIDSAKEFLEKNPELFETNDLSLYTGELNRRFPHKGFANDPSEHGDKLIVVTGRVQQIERENYWGADHTFCIIEDYYYNYYFVHMYGSAENINLKNWVTLTALPLDYFAYKSGGGNNIWAIACAGVTIEK